MGIRRIIRGIITNVLLALLILGLYIGTTEPKVISVFAPIYRGQAEDKVALQFAVSWNAAALGEILDTLKENGVTATFAVSGQWAKDNPDLLRRMVSEGHEIATMGQYPDMEGNLSWTMEDISAAAETIETLCGQRPQLYYAGSRSMLISSWAAKKLGMTHVSCTLDLLSAKGTAEDIINRAAQPIDGGIFLLLPTAACNEALPGLLKLLNGKGLQVTSVGDVLEL